MMSACICVFTCVCLRRIFSGLSLSSFGKVGGDDDNDDAKQPFNR